MSEQLDALKNSLMSCACELSGHLNQMDHTDIEDFGEVVDMIKDVEEAKYYCAITKAMDERSKTDDTQSKIDTALMMERLRNQSENSRSYMEPNYYGGPTMRYPDRRFDEYGRMYYDGRDNRRGGEMTYTQPHVNMSTAMRDAREGRSYVGRRGYMESKENHMPDAVKMQKLEEYVRELGEDITEMIREATPAEKTTIKEKLKRIAEQIV